MADCVPRDRRRRGLAYRFGLGAAFRQQKRQTLLDVRLGFGQAAKKSRGMSGLSTDFRHTAITNNAAAGLSAIAVMTKAGHADMRTTKRYPHGTFSPVLQEE